MGARIALACSIGLLALAGCGQGSTASDQGAGSPDPAVARAEAPAPPTVAEAERFVAELEAELLDAWIAEERAAWVKATYITHDTDLLAARASETVMELVGRKAAEARRFAELELPGPLRRKLDLLRLSINLPAPANAAERKELAGIASSMKSAYGKGRYCPKGTDGNCLDLGELSKVIAASRDHATLLEAWIGWRTIAPPLRGEYARFVELGNAGAVELGFGDLGELWKSRYDVPATEFQAELARLWEQVRPLYEQLHCYVRARLAETYGADKVPADAPIPAHLLGNMWGQSWENIFDLVAPSSARPLDLTAVLEEREFDEVKMVRQAESFFVSLGLEPLPDTFWERSMFTRPRDREVVCHASAWDVDWRDDLRIKMCIELNAEDFTTIHHELGHNYYQRAYKDQPTLFTGGANDGFHEALGDTIALSVTPSYLKRAELIDELPPENLNPLMYRALEKVAFLPFGLVVDRWRFDVFAGQVPPERYNAHWWELRARYQGIAPPVPRSEADFDPGAKYHVPANVPYTRYFLAAILQFQFHRALCRVAGHQGPLHQCSIYGNEVAGQRLDEMMQLGLSRPWPDALEKLTGERRMDATAIADYFAPLSEWLADQNEGRECGW